MCKLHSFAIYIQNLALTVLAILSTLAVSAKALYCMLPTCLSLCHLAQAIQALICLATVMLIFSSL